MTDEELIACLRKRAAEERDVQRNNEAVAAALMGQRLLFDQGIRSKANSFAVRLGLEHESCAKNDAKLARDWDAAADRIEALVRQVKDEQAAKFKMRDERDAAKIAASNYADFNHTWRKRAEQLAATNERLEAALKWQAEQPEAHPFMVAQARAALKGDDHV